jgi:hypothetical protein
MPATKFVALPNLRQKKRLQACCTDVTIGNDRSVCQNRKGGCQAGFTHLGLAADNNHLKHGFLFVSD